jgi:acetoin utilization deacetylase AcuC-like enzyme
MDELVYFYPEGHAVHYEAGHPERPERVEVMRLALQKVGWWDGYAQLQPVEVPPNVMRTVHSPAYLDLLEMSCRRGGHLDADTYTTQASWGLAHKAAGGAVAVADAVWQGRARRGFALTRPPGHHATHGQGMGFCLLNNIAVAAEYLIQVRGVKRLAIVDLDLHHGNGTQDVFWRRGDVFYMSTHQFPFYPGTGALDETGEGAGEKRSANFPLPPGSGDQAFSTIMDGLILPLINRYMPEMILVSYGFDPHWSDPLGYLLLSASMYGQLISRLVDWSDEGCGGRIALFLEGGYNLDAAAACTQAVVAALLKQPWQDTIGPSPYPEGKLWEGVVERARKIWDI